MTDVKRICLYGPESTGKTTLATRLARHYDTIFVPEYSRIFANTHRGVITFEDVETIARQQFNAEEEALINANQFLFCDTDSITTMIYSQHYFGKCPESVRILADQKRYALHLFMDIDLPWQPDPQRDLGSRREEFRAHYLNELEKRQMKHVIIRGIGESRFTAAVSAIESADR